MGISFKLSKAGTRYRPKLSQLPDISPDDISNDNLPVPIDADAEPAVPNRPQVFSFSPLLVRATKRFAAENRFHGKLSTLSKNWFSAER